MIVNKGDIFGVIQEVYIPFDGGKWADHFSAKLVRYMAIENPTNNGSIWAKDSKGRKTRINIKDVVDVRTK